jgi:hypothetical protein
LRRALPLLALLALAPARAAADWEGMLPEIAPALVACLRGFAPDGMVVAAAPFTDGRILARIARGDGSALDCTALPRPPEQPELVRHRVTAEMLRASRGLRAFMLERRCADAWRVDTPDGRVLGWLAYPQC